jgi:hypothetical protein
MPRAEVAWVCNEENCVTMGLGRSATILLALLLSELCWISHMLMVNTAGRAARLAGRTGYEKFNQLKSYRGCYLWEDLTTKCGIQPDEAHRLRDAVVTVLSCFDL